MNGDQIKHFLISKDISRGNNLLSPKRKSFVNLQFIAVLFACFTHTSTVK